MRTSRWLLKPRRVHLNRFDFSPRLDDGEEFYGVRFRAGFYVAKAIDEPLDEAPLPNRTLLHASEAGQQRAALLARGDRIACEQFRTPFAHGNAQIVAALDEQAVGVDKLAFIRPAVEQRVPCVRVAMSHNGICRIEGIPPGFSEP